MFGKELDVNRKDSGDGQSMYGHSILKSSARLTTAYIL